MLNLYANILFDEEFSEERRFTVYRKEKTEPQSQLLTDLCSIRSPDGDYQENLLWIFMLIERFKYLIGNDELSREIIIYFLWRRDGR